MNERHTTFPSAPEAFFLVLCVWALDYLMAYALYDARHWLGMDDLYSLGTIATVLTNGIIFTALLQWKNLSYRELFNASPSASAATVTLVVPLVLLATPLYLLVMGGVEDWLQTAFPMNASLQEEFKVMGEMRLPQIVAGCLLAPVVEEMLFRGIVLRSFLQQYERRYAIIGSAIVFGFAHGNLYQFVGATCFGIVAGWLYERTRSLIPCIALHAAVNTGITFWPDSGAASASVPGAATWILVALPALPACYALRRFLATPAR
jgi:membrane protease YdiL (CAAX protease family)